MSQLALKTKILLGFGSIATILGGVGVTSIVSERGVASNYRHVLKVNLPNMTLLTAMRGLQKDLVIAVATVAGTRATPAEAAAMKSEIVRVGIEFSRAAKSYNEIPFVEGEEAMWGRVDVAWRELARSAEKYALLTAAGDREGDAARDASINGEFLVQRRAFAEEMSKLIDLQGSEAEKWGSRATESADRSRLAVGTTVVFGFLFSILMGIALARQLSRSLIEVTDILTSQAVGIGDVVSQLSSASQELSSASTEQAAALQETASAVQEISSMVQRSSEGARESAASTENSRARAERGKEKIDEMIASIGAIDSSNRTISGAIEEGNRRTLEIVTLIREIGNKTKVINDIVFQTKLLSFNASVEAARAGEHGKGFAVVAEEVGNLAQMSGNASKEISRMLDESVAKVEKMVEENKTAVGGPMLSSADTVRTGVDIAEDCGKYLVEIVSETTTASKRVNEISEAAIEQSRGIDEISKAIQELNESTHTNAVAANQCAGSAEHLDVQALELRRAADRLRTIVLGGDQAMPSSRDAPSTNRKRAVRAPITGVKEGRLAPEVSSVDRAA